jgi:hypothetical protein
MLPLFTLESQNYVAGEPSNRKKFSKEEVEASFNSGKKALLSAMDMLSDYRMAVIDPLAVPPKQNPAPNPTPQPTFTTPVVVPVNPNGQWTWTFPAVPPTQYVNPAWIGIDYGKSVPEDKPKEKKKREQDGCTCVKCQNFYPYAIPNQEDGETLICYGCRTGF